MMRLPWIKRGPKCRESASRKQGEDTRQRTGTEGESGNAWASRS